MKAKMISNVFKIFACLLFIIANIVYFVIKKEFVSIDQQLSLIFAVMTMFTIWLPVDASIIIKNIKDLKQNIRE